MPFWDTLEIHFASFRDKSSAFPTLILESFIWNHTRRSVSNIPPIFTRICNGIRENFLQFFVCCHAFAFEKWINPPTCCICCLKNEVKGCVIFIGC
mmetsp:Transcript_4960/g.20450  ORF Transcript_4960/g.20450 Transcript_4960/m.20450 type:complete len:96 (+) Transcript_4960:5474-5761(+)